MELLKHDAKKDLSTITISDEEFIDIKSIVWYILSTYSKHDKTAMMGVDDVRLRNIESKMDVVLDGIGKAKKSQT